MAKVRELIEKLSHLQPDDEILLGTPYGDSGYVSFDLVRRPATKKVHRGGLRWVTNKAHTTALFIEPKRGDGSSAR